MGFILFVNFTILNLSFLFIPFYCPNPSLGLDIRRRCDYFFFVELVLDQLWEHKLIERLDLIDFTHLLLKVVFLVSFLEV